MLQSIVARFTREIDAEWLPHAINLNHLLSLAKTPSLYRALDDQLHRVDIFHRTTRARITVALSRALEDAATLPSWSEPPEVAVLGPSATPPASKAPVRRATYVASVQETAQTLAAIHRTLLALSSFRALHREALEEIAKRHAESDANDVDQIKAMIDASEVVSPSEQVTMEEAIRTTEKEYMRLTGRDVPEMELRNVAASPVRSRAMSIKRARRNTAATTRSRAGTRVTWNKAAPVEDVTETTSSWRWIWKYVPKNMISLTISLIVFIILLKVKTFPEPEQQNCLAMLVFVLLLWSTEALPLFVTALMVPFLVVVLGILRSPPPPNGPNPPVRLSPKQAAPIIFSAMFPPMMMLLLGGFSLAAALEKYDLAKLIARAVLRRAGKRPSRIGLATMTLATLLSTLVSNVTAPILCFSLLQPILQYLPAESPQAKALILGIALASNVGGLMSPIASPQSLIGSDIMKPSPSWPQFFAGSIPVAILSTVGIWAWLLVVYRPDRDGAELELPDMHRLPSEEQVSLSHIEQGLLADKDDVVVHAGQSHAGKLWGALTPTQWYISFVAFASTLIWCLEPAMDAYVGHLGVVSLFPILALFGPGILTKDDFNGFLWTVMALAMGGVALGRAVDSSGLLAVLAKTIQHLVQGMSLYAVAWVFLIIMLIVSTFVSHTVSALILLPVVYEVGAAMPDPHPQLLVFITMFASSAGMGLPISGFPNMNAIMLEDARGKQYLSTVDFLKGGIPGGLIATVMIGTVGYAIALGLGF